MNKCNSISQCLDLNCARCIRKWEQAQAQAQSKKESMYSRIKNFLKNRKEVISNESTSKF